MDCRLHMSFNSLESPHILLNILSVFRLQIPVDLELLCLLTVELSRSCRVVRDPVNWLWLLYLYFFSVFWLKFAVYWNCYFCFLYNFLDVVQ